MASAFPFYKVFWSSKNLFHKKGSWRGVGRSPTKHRSVRQRLTTFASLHSLTTFAFSLPRILASLTH